MKLSKQNKNIVFTILGVVALVGTYNAVVINSESDLSHKSLGYSKRLDEVYGVKTPGRSLAGTSHWKKLQNPKAEKTVAKVEEKAVRETTLSEVSVSQAAISAELSLNLVEVIHPTKYANGLTANQFNGSITTNNGVIESLTASLPSGESIDVTFSEMNGNVFEYSHNGQNFSGMMYQVDQNAYMVTLTNGPLEGTRMRFSATSGEAEQEQVQETLAQSNVEVGSFGQEETVIENQEVAVQESAQAQTFSF